VFDETHFPFAASKPILDSLDFLLQDILPAPTPDAPTTHAPVVPASHASDDDAGDPVGVDTAILWHGAANRQPQAPRQPAPAPAAAPRQATPAPAAAPVAAE
jgi:hypothetical protein